MRTTLLLGLGVTIATACGGGGGDGDLDTLPKRGERATDPTIVSATASCSGEFMFKGLVVEINASDPAASNLASCAVMSGEKMGQGLFVENVRCGASFEQDCVVDADYVVDLTVSNKTAGVTVASVKLHARP